MAAITRSVHPASSIAWVEFAQACPDLKLGRQDGASTDGLMALVMSDPDGEIHVYPLDAKGKETLLRLLTGGVIVPRLNGQLG